MHIKGLIWEKGRAMLGPIACLILLSYFTFQAFGGSYGLLARQDTMNRLHGLETELAALKADEALLTGKVVRLRPDNLDLDLLDQEARRNLGMRNPLDRDLNNF